MTEQEFAEILEEIVALGHETSGVECKPPGSASDKQLFPEVVRAVLGMSNRRDGGVVIIGVKDTGSSLIPEGLDDSNLVTWNYNHVSDRLQNYADPSVNFELEEKHYQGNKYIVLNTREFTDIPVLCKKSYTVGGNVVLKQGACYVRSRRKPETTEISTQEDMRDLLDLATEKRLRRYVAQAGRAGVALVPPLEQPADQELYEKQLGDLK